MALGFLMLSMGLTLTIQDFKDVSVPLLYAAEQSQQVDFVNREHETE